jgi:hypothetical protein
MQLPESLGLLSESLPLIATGASLDSLEAKESATSIWTSAGSVFAGILIAIGLLVFVACRSQSLSAETDVTESDTEINSDGEISRQGFDIFVSEENALSSNARLSGRWPKDSVGNAVE